jgi:(p)ppGpp synthase/HD superfamily hydrolase
MMNLLGRAILIAKKAHEGQFDKSGVPYIEHVRYVAQHAGEYGIEAEIIGWLHDVVEDTSITLDDLRAVFPAEIIDAVDAITRRFVVVSEFFSVGDAAHKRRRPVSRNDLRMYGV